MGVDLSQFHQVFIEESIEGLDVMESALMELDPDNIESETINSIFRSAHSIKGGSATFGFTAIAEFTHVLETLLDQVRAGKRGLNSGDVDLFLQSVDCMREMLELLKDNDNRTTPLSESLKTQFESILDGDQATPSESSEGEEVEASVVQDWCIRFVPGKDILKSGNDPLRIFSALQDLGEIEVGFDESSQPGFTEFDPEELYLSWDIKVYGCECKESILEQFEWVADESLIELMPLANLEFSINSAAPIDELGKTVNFIPNQDIFLSGNDPFVILRSAHSLCSDVGIEAHLENVPSIKSLDPEKCFVYWELHFNESIDDKEINELFEWVEEEADINIREMAPKLGASEPLDSTSTASVSSEPNSSQAQPQQAAKGDSAKNVKSAPIKKAAQSESSSIRVGIDKIDNLINMVGELVITQSMLGQLGNEFDLNKTPKLLEGLSQLEQNTRELQESVMRIRMLPISFAFSRFPRMVRDLGQQLGKKIDLEMQGEQTELDKTVMEKIGDPLVHLVRNAIDHGIEPATDRVRSGKSETGKITLNAYHQGGNVVIEIVDDGKGLDREVILSKALDKGLITEVEATNLSDDQVFDLIFQPGFSTAAQVSDISGRGVGMDVVKRNIQSLNGVVEISSKKGEGSRIRIRLPLTLAILDGQLVRVGQNIYIFPLVSIVESMQCRADFINHIAGNHSVFRLRDDYVPIVPLNQVFATSADYDDLDQALIVVVESDGDKVGIVVDELLAQQQVVIKSLEQNYRRIEGVSGATILGDGTVALIVDIPGVVKLAGADHAKHMYQQGLHSDEQNFVGRQRA